VTLRNLPDGTYAVAARVTDAAGNVFTSAPVTVVIDTTTEVSAPDLSASSDDGPSSLDNVTSVRTPTLTGKAEPGAAVQVFQDQTVLGGANTTAEGLWSITLS